MIVTQSKQRTPSLPSKKPFGIIYEGIKQGLKTAGLYQEYGLERFDPEVLHQKYIGKYYYKPRKRVAGYAGQKLWSKKKLHATRNKQYQKYSRYSSRNNLDSCHYRNSKGSQYTSLSNKC